MEIINIAKITSLTLDFSYFRANNVERWKGPTYMHLERIKEFFQKLKELDLYIKWRPRRDTDMIYDIHSTRLYEHDQERELIAVLNHIHALNYDRENCVKNGHIVVIPHWVMAKIQVETNG